jgi:hypothetical protein
MQSIPIILGVVFQFGPMPRGNVIILPTPPVAEFKDNLKRLEHSKDKEVRLGILKWLSRHAWAKSAELAIPVLERTIRTDPVMEVRRDAIATLSTIARQRKKPCPLGLVEGLLDKHEEVRFHAAVYIGLFKSFAPGTVDILLRGARSEDANCRRDSLLILADAGRKDKRALAAIEKGTHDKDFMVRMDAHRAMFEATGNLGPYLAYMIRVREDPDGVLSPAEKNSEIWKREHAFRNLFLIGSLVRLHEWSEERPDELASFLVKFLDDKSPMMRRGSANLIGQMVLPAFVKKDWAKGILPDPEPKKGKQVQKAIDPAGKSKLLLPLAKRQAAQRLRELRDHDLEASVCDAARTALKRLSEVEGKK